MALVLKGGTVVDLQPVEVRNGIADTRFTEILSDPDKPAPVA